MRHLLPAVLLSSLVACTTGGTQQTAQSDQSKDDVLNEGSLVIARPLPKKATTEATLFGFMPQKAIERKASLVIDAEHLEVHLKNSSGETLSTPLSDVTELEPGSYTVVHKQRHPIWYATDEYFTKRGLPIPEKNSQERYLKGALGDFVIYLNEETPIHNASIFTDEVGGVRLSDNQIAQVYYQLEIGSQVEVK